MSAIRNHWLLTPYAWQIPNAQEVVVEENDVEKKHTTKTKTITTKQ